MFTFGIFTTHFPYVAVVVFYAYFLLTGANKVSTGELSFSEKTYNIEIQSATTVDTVNTTCYYYLAEDEFFWSSFFEDNLFKRKVKISDRYILKGTSSAYLPNLFNRPPPAIV